MKSLKEFYLEVLRNFADGKPLPYKFKTKDKQGITKSFIQYNESKFWTPSQFLYMIKMDREYKEMISGKNKSRKTTLPKTR